ncbi:MAG: hypothetical protein AAF298_01635 [Cyanobacteria bacterium P01_A01_bin.40]
MLDEISTPKKIWIITEESHPQEVISGARDGSHDTGGLLREESSEVRGAPNDGSVWLEDGNNNLSPLRGGSWTDYPYVCRSAYRNYDFGGRDLIYYDVGFRVVGVGGRTL